MSINGPSETTVKASRGRSDGGFLGLLSAVALIAVVAGALGSVGLMLWVGHRNPSRVLLVLFAMWDLSPFIALVLADIVSKRWSVLTRATLYCVTLVITLGSLAIYAEIVVVRPAGSANAFLFVVVPPASWVLMTIVVPMIALISGRLSRRGAGT
jgi:hypothetical protein